MISCDYPSTERNGAACTAATVNKWETSNEQASGGESPVVTRSTQGLGQRLRRSYVVRKARRSSRTGLSAAGRQGRGEERSGRNAHLRGDRLRLRVDDCRRLIDGALDRFGKVDILVNNAVDATRATVDDVTPEIFDGIFGSTCARRCCSHTTRHQILRQGRASSSTSAASTPFMGEPVCWSTPRVEGRFGRVAQPRQLSSSSIAFACYCVNSAGWTPKASGPMMKQLGTPPIHSSVRKADLGES